jgi:hypothetical protein
MQNLLLQTHRNQAYQNKGKNNGSTKKNTKKSLQKKTLNQRKQCYTQRILRGFP